MHADKQTHMHIPMHACIHIDVLEYVCIRIRADHEVIPRMRTHTYGETHIYAYSIDHILNSCSMNRHSANIYIVFNYIEVSLCPCFSLGSNIQKLMSEV